MNKNILITMALESECRGRFTKENIIYTGVGKVNAAYHLTKSLSNNNPKIVINLGSAGSSIFKRGEIVNCTKFVQRDMDVQPLGFPKWVTPFDENNDATLSYGMRISNLEEGICGTGDSFDVSFNEPKYNLVDMEAYALAKICQKENIKFVCLKYITDGADKDAAHDWTQSLENASSGLFREYEKLQKLIC